MSHLTNTAVAEEHLLDLDAMASIVRELVMAGSASRIDAPLLRARAGAAGLGPHAASALEALRQKLCRGAALLNADGIASWV